MSTLCPSIIKVPGGLLVVLSSHPSFSHFFGNSVLPIADLQTFIISLSQLGFVHLINILLARAFTLEQEIIIPGTCE